MSKIVLMKIFSYSEIYKMINKFHIFQLLLRDIWRGLLLKIKKESTRILFYKNNIKIYFFQILVVEKH